MAHDKAMELACQALPYFATDEALSLAANIIDAALLAERQACAKAARAAVMKFRHKVGGRYYAGYHEDMREAVARAVLERIDRPAHSGV